MTDLVLHLADGTAIAVPASLTSITTYVLLEQEAWFEKETAILDWFKPGMVAIDIGANLGVYCLPLARRVAPGGAVFAYEPASETRALLEKSRGLNRLDGLHLIAAALSDAPREGHLVFANSSELHSLGEGGPGEAVRIASLDEEDVAHNWPSVDFVKIDAEGEELRIIAGGQKFFARHSPLVMFERKSGPEIDLAMPDGFRSMGYGVYRLLAGAPVLVPVEAGEPLDQYELNLFAAKPDRAAALAREGHLVETVPVAWVADEAARIRALALPKTQHFASAFLAFFAQTALDPVYRDALAAYATWRTANFPLPERYAALQFAYRSLSELCRTAATPARLSTLARIAWEMGENSAGLDALDALCRMGQHGEASVNEPFWPANPRFDAIAPGARAGEWFIVGVVEQLERTISYSSGFSSGRSNLDWLAGQPLASIEMERRRLLKRLRAGEPLPVPARLLTPAPGHINADIWRKGLVPNTLK